MEPKLIEDYNSDDELPPSLANVLQRLKEKVKNPNEHDVFVGVLYILMLEACFIPKGATLYWNDPITFNYQRVLALSQELPNDWKVTADTYQFDLILPQLPQFECCMTCTVHFFKTLMGVKCEVKNIKESSTCVIQLSPSKYVVTEPKISLKDLRELAVTFKTLICYKIKCAILERSVFRKNSLNELPGHVLIQIFSHLEYQDLANIGLTCTYFSEVHREKKLWMALLEKNFKRHLEHIEANLNYERLPEEYARLVKNKQKIELTFAAIKNPTKKLRRCGCRNVEGNLELMKY